MRKFNSAAIVLAALFGIALFSGCEWDGSGGDGGFNTSRGAGVFVNFSGYYQPKDGANIVGDNVKYLVLTQIGNSIEVFDSNNSYYTGTVGTPGVQTSPDPISGAYPIGAHLLQAQVSFQGINAASGHGVEFIGVVSALAASYVHAEGYATRDYDTITTNEAFLINQPPIQFGDARDQTIGQSYTRLDAYFINEANAWYLLQGTWVEGGVAMSAKARAPAQDGNWVLEPDFQGDFDGDVSVQDQNDGGGQFTTGPTTFEGVENPLDTQ